jgi:hypothetical protein
LLYHDLCGRQNSWALELCFLQEYDISDSKIDDIKTTAYFCRQCCIYHNMRLKYCVVLCGMVWLVAVVWLWCGCGVM